MKMVSIRDVREEDKAFWMSIDRHVSEEGFCRKVRDHSGYLLLEDEKPVGLMHYSLLWDCMPFLNFIFLLDPYRGKGYGTKLLCHWEAEMKKAGFSMALISTQADEEAQHFYRRLGYKDCGCLVLNDCPMEQAMELFFCKTLG